MSNLKVLLNLHSGQAWEDLIVEKITRDEIEAEVLKTAQRTLNKLPKDKQNTALDFLTQQVQQFGSIEAKQIFERNPELKLSEVISATPSRCAQALFFCHTTTPSRASARAAGAARWALQR